MPDEEKLYFLPVMRYPAAPVRTDGLFVDGQEEKPIANAHQDHDTSFSSTGRGESKSQAHSWGFSSTWGALTMSFSLCLTRKRPSHRLAVRLRWAFPPACRGKGRLRSPDGLFLVRQVEKSIGGLPRCYPGPLVGACDRLFPLPKKEKSAPIVIAQS